LNKKFGGNHVLKDVSFEIKGAEMIGLIGPNGAGKTTLTNVLDGAVKPNSGTVYLNGKRIDQLPPFEIAKTGLGRTFQVTRSFRRMTVLENLYVPALALGKSHTGNEVKEQALEVLAKMSSKQGADKKRIAKEKKMIMDLLKSSGSA
jgi:branched-chain amino acid transport system ATP-binding protein